jgi:hypothetical protein
VTDREVAARPRLPVVGATRELLRRMDVIGDYRPASPFEALKFMARVSPSNSAATDATSCAEPPMQHQSRSVSLPTNHYRSLGHHRSGGRDIPPGRSIFDAAVTAPRTK